MAKCQSCEAINPADASFCTTCGSPIGQSDTLGGLQTEPFERDPKPGPNTNDNLDLEQGSLFAGRYTIGEKIGQGGMGMVYKATEDLAGRTRNIALKLIRTDRLGDQRAVDKLISEGALTQDIRHPNVVAVYNVGEAEGHPFVAMDFVEGQSLREWHRRKINGQQEVPTAVTSEIILALLDGLEAAHQLGVVHRDLKPENIILTEEPSAAGAQLQILDFGIARAPGTLDNFTGTGLGTPRYMAPEQITNPAAAGPEADLYSLSVLFYELLMDVLPQGHWQPPSGSRSDIPTAIDNLIEQGLSNRPASRQRSADEYRQALKTAIDEEHRTPAPPPPSPPPTPPGPGNSVRNWAIGGGGGLLLLAGLGYCFEKPDISGNTNNEETAFFDEDDLNDEGLDEDTIEPQGSEVTYSDFAGRWNIDIGGHLNINVDQYGNFSGRGPNAFGSQDSIEGNLESGQYIVNGTLAGELAWDGGCHLDFVTYNPDGSVNLISKFHIDHASGADCPVRFGQ
ncbi:MAG: serine/threonine-protein kinase [Erythrobacter sp.]